MTLVLVIIYDSLTMTKDTGNIKRSFYSLFLFGTTFCTFNSQQLGSYIDGISAGSPRRPENPGIKLIDW